MLLRSRLTMLLIAVLTALALAPMPQASAAQAADEGVGLSSFSFTVDYFDASLKSRTWKQAAGSTDVKANLRCYDNISGSYLIRLYREGLFGGQRGPTHTFPCGREAVHTFTGLSAGHYHFIASRNVAPPYSGSGSVTHPSTYGCDGADPATWDPSRMVTLNTAYTTDGRRIQLRGLSGRGCTWARIDKASSGNSVWIDRTGNGGGSWNGPMYKNGVAPGFTQAHTLTVDKGGTAWVRACGHGSNGAITCTAWRTT